MQARQEVADGWLQVIRVAKPGEVGLLHQIDLHAHSPFPHLTLYIQLDPSPTDPNAYFDTLRKKFVVMSNS